MASSSNTVFFSEKYTKIGVADGQSYGKDSLCTFTIYGNKYKGRNKTGEMFSPTYPGILTFISIKKVTCNKYQIRKDIFYDRNLLILY